MTVLEAFESGTLDLPDFYFTGNDYRYRLETEAKRRFLERLGERFNVGVRYNGRGMKWDTVIEQKTVELGRYLVGRTGSLDFEEPSPSLLRTDDQELRKRILDLSQSQARKLGVGRSTLHHLRQKARNRTTFKVYERTREKLDS